RLIKDVHDIDIDDLTLKAFQDAGFPHIEEYFPPAQAIAAARRKRLHVALGYAWGIAALSVVLTLAGTAAALWHMRWWIGTILLSMTGLGALLVVAVIWRSLPPATEAEQKLK